MLSSVDCDHVILGGDFNFIIDADKDCYGYSRENNVNARNKLISICNKYSLIDVWRHYYPGNKQFTWSRSNPNQGARLDMFFISDHLSSLCFDVKITPGYRTDHMISFGVQVGESLRGPGLWKFNESLLQDENYVKVVEECIDRTIEQYAIPIYAQSFLLNPCNYMNIELQIKEDLFYETLLMMIRGETVKFAKKKAKRAKEKEKELILKMENAHLQHCGIRTEESAASFEKCKEELENFRKTEISGLIVRSRTKWHEEGERSSKYFLGLEKRNAMRKSVTALRNGDQILTRTSAILDAFTDNLSSKYNKNHSIPESADMFIKKNVSASLTEQERKVLDMPLSYEELTKAVARIKKGKSPGSNGYTSTFFKYFWNRLGPFLYRAFYFCFQTNQMVPSHREGIVTMIPKAGKSPDNLKAWRPITLLNTDFKIISMAIAARLQSVIGKLTDPCQTAYIRGRFIGENTRLVYDVINHLSNSNKPGFIMSADFEAAFDSLSWDFMSKVLRCCNFGQHFRKLLSTIYLSDNNFSRIILNGFLGSKIFLRCGIRQGDPVSGYLFNLAVNVLANQIKQSYMLTGIQLSGNQEVRITQYADDTVLFINNSTRSLKGALFELNTFSKFSGLNLNIEKTLCLPIGVDEQQYSSENFGFKWVRQMKVLGITFAANNERITQTNMEPKLIQMKKEIAQWRRRNLTPLGKITVIKSLLLSKKVHILTALPSPSCIELKELESIFFAFLWGSKRDPIKRSKAVQNFSEGGLNMIDLQAFVRSLKLSWLKRLVASNAVWAKLVDNEILNVDAILHYGSKKIETCCRKINNPFWKDVLEAFGRFSQDYNPGMPHTLTESLWFSESDRTKFKYMIVKSWNQKGFRFLADLVDESTRRVMTREALKTKFGIKMTILCYSSLMKSIPESMKQEVSYITPKPIIPIRMNLVMNHPHFSRFAYNILIARRQNEFIRSNASQEQKWKEILDVMIVIVLLNLLKARAQQKLGCFIINLSTVF